MVLLTGNCGNLFNQRNKVQQQQHVKQSLEEKKQQKKKQHFCDFMLISFYKTNLSQCPWVNTLVHSRQTCELALWNVSLEHRWHSWFSSGLDTVPSKTTGTVRPTPVFWLCTENLWVWHQKTSMKQAFISRYLHLRAITVSSLRPTDITKPLHYSFSMWWWCDFQAFSAASFSWCLFFLLFFLVGGGGVLPSVSALAGKMHAQ